MKEYTKWARQTSGGTKERKYHLNLLWKTDKYGTPLKPLKYEIAEYRNGEFSKAVVYSAKNLAFYDFYRLVSEAWLAKIALEGDGEIA